MVIVGTRNVRKCLVLHEMRAFMVGLKLEGVWSLEGGVELESFHNLLHVLRDMGQWKLRQYGRIGGPSRQWPFLAFKNST